MQRSSSGTVGRHRQELLHRHRAPAFPTLFANRGRSALSVTALAATLATGVGMAGVAGATPGELSASQTPDPQPVTSPASQSATAAASPPATAAPQPETFPGLQPATAAPQPGTSAATAPAGYETAPTTYQAAPRGYVRQAQAGGVLSADAPVAAQNPTTGPAAAPMQRKERPVAAPTWVHPLASGRVTSCFGPRWGRLHAGVDLAAPHGAPVLAAGAGVVVSAGVAAGYGNAVLIDHGNGYLTHYGHLASIAVQVGQDVAAGHRIGAEGSTGHSTGPHLHFEVHREHYKNPIEPTTWMRAHGVDIGCATD